jgi:hypothetical protein
MEKRKSEEEYLMNFCTYLFIICGQKVYEVLLTESYNKILQVLYSNLPLPSISKLQQNMRNSDDNKIIEGQVRMSKSKDVGNEYV